MLFHVPFVLTLIFVPQHVHPQAAAGDPLATSSLTAEAVRQLLDGEGMGLARPAEMNNYPGPKHLLDRAQELALTTEQQKEISAIRQQVLDRAKPLGRAIVDAERELDAAFKSGTLRDADLKKQLDAIARLQAELRMVHLRAHLITKPILTPEQIRRYYERR
jgi:Spy/CpxP family protein refolding chaperone